MWPFKKAKAETRKTGKRQFQAAGTGRLFASLPTSAQSINYDLRMELDRLRSRSRHFSVNNPYGRKFLQMCSTHIVGPTGFTLAVRVTDTNAKGTVTKDKLASDAIEKAFWKWAKRGNCDVTGLHSFFDICNIAIKAIARDGETIIRKIYGSNAGPYGFQLQILDVERLDVARNEDLKDGRTIKMGIELNEYGKPLAFHLRTKHPGENPYYTMQGSYFERVPAEDCYHIFIADRPEQNRGIPWMHAAMVSLGNLGGYEEAAIIAARVGAAKMGFFTTPDGDGKILSDGEDAEGNLITEAEPGAFPVLPEGYGFEKFDPDYPHAMYDKFVKSCLRSISSGLGVAYNTLSNDLEGVNFSSIRTGVLEERDCWMALQNWFIESFMDDVFSTWLKFALLSKAILLPNGSALPIAKFDKFNVATWRGRRWQWVDPRADIEANVKAINNALKSRADVIAEQGKDAEEVFAELADEQQQIEDLGIFTEPMIQKAQAEAQIQQQSDSGGGNTNG